MKNLRKDRGLTQETLAQKCGVSRSLVALVETGHYKPYPSLQKRIARALGVAVTDLFGDNK